MRTSLHTSRLARAALSLAAAALAACSAATTGVPATTASLRSGPAAGYGRTSDYLGIAEMQATSAQSALDLVRRLRPEYLRADPARRTALGAFGVPAGAPLVYVDGNRWGGVESLNAIPAYLVTEIRRVPAQEAHARYGLVDYSPVIDVRLMRRP